MRDRFRFAEYYGPLVVEAFLLWPLSGGDVFSYVFSCVFTLTYSGLFLLIIPKNRGLATHIVVAVVFSAVPILFYQWVVKSINLTEKNGSEWVAIDGVLTVRGVFYILSIYLGISAVSYLLYIGIRRLTRKRNDEH